MGVPGVGITGKKKAGHKARPPLVEGALRRVTAAAVAYSAMAVSSAMVIMSLNLV